MNKHTPGPWAVYPWQDDYEGADKFFYIAQQEGAPFTPYYSDVADIRCACTCSGEILEIQEANARLLAAAPDLLDALEHIIEYWNRDRNDHAMHDALWHIIETADAAISKALGKDHNHDHT